MTITPGVVEDLREATIIQTFLLSSVDELYRPPKESGAIWVGNCVARNAFAAADEIRRERKMSPLTRLGVARFRHFSNLFSVFVILPGNKTVDVKHD
jgi:hypothetical protein